MRDLRAGIRYDVIRGEQREPEYEVGFTACWSLAWGRWGNVPSGASGNGVPGTKSENIFSSYHSLAWRVRRPRTPPSARNPPGDGARRGVVFVTGGVPDTRSSSAPAGGWRAVACRAGA